MKKIYDIVSMAILLFCTAACSDSYLELSPESSVSDEVIFENADAAQYAVNGLVPLCARKVPSPSKL